MKCLHSAGAALIIEFMTRHGSPLSPALQEILDFGQPLVGPSVLYRILGGQVPAFTAVRQRAEAEVAPFTTELGRRIRAGLQLAVNGGSPTALLEALQGLGAGVDMQAWWQALLRMYARISEPLGSPPEMPFVMSLDLQSRIWEEAQAQPGLEGWLEADGLKLLRPSIVGVTVEGLDEVAGLPQGTFWRVGEAGYKKAAQRVERQLKAGFVKDNPVEALNYWVANRVLGLRVEQIAEYEHKSSERVRSQIRQGDRLLNIRRSAGRPRRGSRLPIQEWEAMRFEIVLPKPIARAS